MHRTKLVDNDNILKRKQTVFTSITNCTGFLSVGALLKQCTYHVWEGLGKDKRVWGRDLGIL